MKYKIAYISILLALILSGCQYNGQDIFIEPDTPATTSMFVEVERETYWKIVYHKETKVMYAVSYGAYNCGNFTMLVDADGKPMLWKGNGRE